MIAAQSNAPSLAGLLVNVSVENLTKPHISLAGFLTNLNFEHLVKLSVHQTNICPMFSQLTYLKSQGCKADLKTPDHQKLNEKKDSTANAILSTTANEYQPFGSMPNRSSSLRPSVFSQFPRLMFSAAAAASNCALSSGDKRTLNIGERPAPLGTLSLSMIDMYRPITILSIPLGLYLITVRRNKETPTNGITSTERGLTTTDSESIEEAVMQNTTHPQGRHSLTQNSGNEPASFVWIIAAVRRDCPTVKATIHHIAAATEREARRTLAKDHVCFFAGRIRQGVSHA